MDDPSGGDFSKSWISLQLQLRTLLEEAGGDNAMTLLDTLCKLRKSERGRVLGALNRVIDQIVATERPDPTADDEALQRFEDELYRDLLSALNPAHPPRPARAGLEVLRGGKTHQINSRVVSLDEARARRGKQLLQ
jgi:hypothetical protein